MTSTAIRSWQTVKAEVMRRISERIWQPGDLIPAEVDLASEFGCARATVNRALRDLADEGLLDRRRKAGTRVSANPVRKATMRIPVTRLDVEQRGAVHSHHVIDRALARPPAAIAHQLELSPDKELLHIRAMHNADDRPFLFEDRWVNQAAVPAILNADFSMISANEWLVHNAPVTTGDITFSAANANADEAGFLEIDAGVAIFVVNRITWNQEQPVTSVRLAYAPGFEMQTNI